MGAIIGIVIWKISSNNNTGGLRAAQAATKSEPAVQTKVVEKIIEREVPARSAPAPRQCAAPAPRKRSGWGRSFKKACAWGAGFSIGSSVASWLFRRRLPEKSE